MRKNIIVVSFLVTLLVGCGIENKSNETLEIITEKKEETTLPTVLPVKTYEDLDTLPKEILDILYCDGIFYEVEHQKEFTKESYKVQVDENTWEDLEWKSYRVYDLDADGEKELIVTIEESPSKPFIEIFDKQEDKVYAYALPYRGFTGLYTDGAVAGSSGADTGTFSTIKFDKNKYEETIIAESLGGNKGWYVEGEEVTEEEYYEFISRYHNEQVIIPWSTRPLDEVIKE